MVSDYVSLQLDCIAKLEFSKDTVVRVVSSTKDVIMVSFLFDNISELMIFEITNAEMLTLLTRTKELSVAYSKFVESIAKVKKKKLVTYNNKHKNR